MNDLDENQADIEAQRKASLRDLMLQGLQDFSPLDAQLCVVNAGLMAIFHGWQRKLEAEADSLEFDAHRQGIETAAKLARAIESCSRLAMRNEVQDERPRRHFRK